MTSTRAYQPAKSLEAALEEIHENTGKKYDPVVVEALQNCWDAGKVAAIASR
jgi:HD-GYP domain-containing protein (c-di-GMP phosphodiesterase class II)